MIQKAEIKTFRQCNAAFSLDCISLIEKKPILNPHSRLNRLSRDRDGFLKLKWSTCIKY